MKYVFFDSGSAALDDKSKYELDEIASILEQNSTVRVELRGHTDNTGDADANRLLSDQRAGSVRDYLVNAGVDASRLTSVGFGQSQPIDSNETAEGRETNRRTELRIVSK